jgi:serine/threonine-protein kinase
MLGSYEILEAIGEGGMARIYRGFHAELNRYAAIKVINWGLQEDPEFTERFRREAQAIASLRHPNIVQIFDFGKHTSGYFMVMEFIDGSDLAVRLRQYRGNGKLLPKDQVLRIIKDVAAALDYAHDHNVIHRDVKPSNIMINREGQSILTDFGLVMLPAHASKATLGNTFGTPHYVAPEQAISSAAAVGASDIYSLGVILYEMATGQLPFDDESPLSVALKHISDFPPAPRTINPDLPQDVEDVIMRTLAKDPTDRFATASDMASALQAAWGNGVSSAIGSGKSFIPPVLPAGVPPAAQVSSITLPNAAAIAPAATAEIAPAEVFPKADQTRKRIVPMWLSLALVGLAGVMIGALGFFFVGGFNPPPTPTFTPPPTNAIVIVDVEPVETPTPTATTTHTPQPPTETPTPTSTATSTPTPVLTDTPTPIPTDTPTPIPTDTPTLTPVPTNTPIPIIPTVTPTPTPASLSGKILFKTDRGGSTEIYQMDGNGANQVPLPREDWSLYSELQATLPFSPDKKNQIVVRGEGQLDLWWANLESGMELRVTSTGRGEYDPAWSPVDNRIAYVSEETGNGDIYMLNLDGSAVTRLTENLTNFDKHPTWSPDGQKLTFWSDRSFNGNRQIYVIDLATRQITSLSDNPFNDWDPVWVP